MSLSAKSSVQSARRKFFMNSTYIMSRSWNQTYLCSGEQNESKCLKHAPIDERKIFHELDMYHV